MSAFRKIEKRNEPVLNLMLIYCLSKPLRYNVDVFFHDKFYTLN